MIAAGTTLDGYRLRRMVGKGALGTVWEAVDTRSRRVVAIKVLQTQALASRKAVKRFLREAKVLTKILHPNVVAVYEVGACLDGEQEVPYIVEELIVGYSLEEALAALPKGRFDPAEALRVVLPLVDALEVVHAMGVVHRDLKPGNVMLCRNEDGTATPKLIDFGVAKVQPDGDETQLTREGVAVGSPGYMAPEQLMGVADLDARADVWSLGVVLYELLSGRRPYEAASLNELMAAILRDPPVPLDQRTHSLPADLVAVVHMALQHDRGLRLVSVRAFADALRATASGASLLAAPIPYDATMPVNEPDDPRSTTGDAPRVGTAHDRSFWWKFALVAVLVSLAAAGIGFALARASGAAGQGAQDAGGSGEASRRVWMERARVVGLAGCPGRARPELA